MGLLCHLEGERVADVASQTGVYARLLEDVVDERGGRGLSVSAGDADGIFLDEEGKLAAYNLKFSTSRESCLVVRKNLLDKFQKEKKLHLVWILKAGKEIYDDDGGILGESCWSGLIAYSSKGVTGSLKKDS